MEQINELFYSIDNFLLRGIFVGVLVILIAKFILKDKINSELAFSIIKAVMLIHSTIYILILTTSILLNNTGDRFWLRAFGPHWWAYWFMMSLNSGLPFTLLIKSLGKNHFYLLLVSVMMNFGFIFESITIHLTSIERDYIPEDWVVTEHYNPYLPSSQEIEVLTHGLFIGILLLVISNLYKWLINLYQSK